MEAVDPDKLREVCVEIVRAGDLETLTGRDVRRRAEKRLGLEHEALEEKPYKELVKEIVVEALEGLPDAEDGAGGGKADDASGDGSDGSFSEVNDEEPAPARPRKRAAAGAGAAEGPKPKKRARAAAAATAGSKGSETTIKNLKNYVSKCGVRKVWSKELAGMSAAQQVRHLKGLLESLGVEGRPTLEKCRRIKDKRDLQAELEDIGALGGGGNGSDGSGGSEGATARPAAVARGRRRAAAVAKLSYADGSDGDNDDANGAGGAGAEESGSEESDAYTEGGSGDNGSDAAEASAGETGPDSEPE
ncbi:hypothetical protein H4R18_003453 [Coemansia javaensis]|uniref:DEK-C domain-containing protein n=1 Tax=Coemansia javaensis TaxID=2761396 RepID=A0A9W8H8P8_9FUNG|nr:hypothetical protein H4R18_003453 [Coemansia javaensis]